MMVITPLSHPNRGLDVSIKRYRRAAVHEEKRRERGRRSRKQSLHKPSLKDKSARSIESKTVSNPASGLLAPLRNFTFIIDNQWLAGRSLSGGCACREQSVNVSVCISATGGVTDESTFMCLLFETSLKC